MPEWESPVPGTVHRPQDSAPQGSSHFREVFAEHPAGVCVVLWGSPGRMGGLTASSVGSVSADPPLLVFSVDRRSRRLDSLRRAAHLTVSFLAADQEAVARRFAARGVDPIPGAALELTASGAAVIAGSRGWIRAELVSETDVGGSSLIVLGAVECHVTVGRDPLVYMSRRFATVAVPAASADDPASPDT